MLPVANQEYPKVARRFCKIQARNIMGKSEGRNPVRAQILAQEMERRKMIM